MDCRSDFRTFRKWYYYDLSHVLVFLGDRLSHKIFDVISVNATKHMIVITIGTQRSAKEMVTKWLDPDYIIGEDSVDTTIWPTEIEEKKEKEVGMA